MSREYKTLPERLKFLRVAHFLTQEKLAKELGYTKKMISRYENGESVPPYDVLTFYSNRFSVTTDWLLKGSAANGKSN